MQVLGSKEFGKTYLALDMAEKPKFCIVQMYDLLALILDIL